MYFSPCRRRGNGVAGARARQQPAGHHEGDRRDFLRRHELEAAAAVHGTAATKQDFVARLLSRTADSRNLRLAWDHCAQGDGQAPGLDGLRFDELDDHEVWSLIRTLRKVILANTYRPGPDRTKQIPKASGKGTRTLSIPRIIDRMVQRAVVQTVQPYLDGFLGDRCLGFRPSSDTNRALALAEELIVQDDCWVLLAEDLKDAFDNVPQKRLLDVIRIFIPNSQMMTLLERLVLTDTGRGIRQGGNLSPLLLNLYLHHHLDKRWSRQHPNVPLLRWADDILVLCRSKEQALTVYKGLKDLLLPIGMRLKSEPERAIRDLKSGEPADWLGYRLSRDEEALKVSLTEKAWTSLAMKLEQAHQMDGSPLKAAETITGWISQMGPCYNQTSIDQASARIGDLAFKLAFDEIPSQEEIRRSWHSAHKRWERCRRARKGNQKELHAAPPR